MPKANARSQPKPRARTSRRTGAGRPAHRPTERTRGQVTSAVACGLSTAEVAFTLGIGETQLREHYADELKHGLALANHVVGSRLYRTAIGKNKHADARTELQAQVAWLKMRGGPQWQEGPAVVVNTGPTLNVDASIRTVVANLRGLSPEALAQFTETLGRLLPEPGTPPEGFAIAPPVELPDDA